MNNPTNTETLVRESVLAKRMNIPRAQFKQWRENGDLIEGEHWLAEGQAFVFTEAGESRVLQLIAVPTDTVTPLTKVPVLAVAAGVNPRILRCRPADGSGMVSVRLTGPRVFASGFRRGDRLDAVPTDLEGVLEYDGPVPRRMRL